VCFREKAREERRDGGRELMFGGQNTTLKDRIGTGKSGFVNQGRIYQGVDNQK
jgi:hypothetical protein